MPGNTFYISFPGLGIEPFSMTKTAFSLFGRDVAWYGILICTGMLLAFFYGLGRIKREKISVDDYYNLLLLIIPFGIMGARLYYVLTSLDYYRGRPFLDWIAVWEGGIAIYGAIIAGILCILIYTRAKKLPLFKILDAFAPALLIGQILGRWGNFCNGEAHGYATSLPWRMGLGMTEEITEFFHPTFLYESLWNLALFLIIHFFLYRKKKYDGEIFCFYAAFYGIGRAFIEMLRTDSLYIFGTVRISSLVGFASFAIFGTLFLLGFARAKKAPPAEEKAPVVFESTSVIGKAQSPEKPEDTNIPAEDTAEGKDQEL